MLRRGLLRIPLRGAALRLPWTHPRVAVAGLSTASGSGGFCCHGCGQPFAKWQGQCSACGEWGTVGPAAAAAAAATPASRLYRQGSGAAMNPRKAARAVPTSVSWMGMTPATTRIPMVHRMKDVTAMDVGDSSNGDKGSGSGIVRRIELPDRELNWVLGGGLVAGSLTLVAGDPGVGKSTLALQIANMLAAPSPLENRRVLYISGEESVLQVKMRAERLGAIHDGLFVGSETNIDEIVRMIEGNEVDDDDCDVDDEDVDDEAEDRADDSSSSAAARARPPLRRRQRPRRGSGAAFDAVVIDSIQTVFADELPSPAGTVTQVKECTLRLLRLAKHRHLPVLLIGHVTKSGDIAGPKVLEHIVDTVVHLEGDPQSARRFLRCQKNRFGNTSEVGVFHMTDAGLAPLVNPLLAFVSDTAQDLAAGIDGASLTIAMEGSRPIPLEIQALANRAAFGPDGKGFSRARGVGVGFDKLQLLFAVLEKRAKVSFYNRNVFVNVAEGYVIHEPAADLALAVALASAVLGRPVRPRTAFLGELALSGHLRPVKMLESRLLAAHKIGLEACVIPRVHCPDTRRALEHKFANKLTLVESATLLDALRVALHRADGDDDNDDEGVDGLESRGGVDMGE